MGWFNSCLERLKSITDNGEGELFTLIEMLSSIPYSEIRGKWVFSNADEKQMLTLLNDVQQNEISDLVSRRMSGEPLQYITGKTDFYGYEFLTEKGVLIPRFDTEIIVDTALSVLNEGDSVLDLCCGSGCIGITLALNKSIALTMADISAAARALSAKNAAKHGVTAKIISLDVMSEITCGCYDLIACNPPYIETAVIKELSSEVQNEPSLALDGGIDGLMFYERIISTYKPCLKAGGFLCFEFGIGQSESIVQLLLQNGFGDILVKKDYNGIERAVLSKLNLKV